MSSERKVLVYGASGYTGKIIAECLAQRNIPFYMAGRTQSRLEEALKIVEERHGAAVRRGDRRRQQFPRGTAAPV